MQTPNAGQLLALNENELAPVDVHRVAGPEGVVPGTAIAGQGA